MASRAGPYVRPAVAAPPAVGKAPAPAPVVVMATYQSQPAVLGSWRWGDNPAAYYQCEACGAAWQTVVSLGRAPQSFHLGGELASSESGQSGMCPTCKVYWKELE